jgi:hypothetical protein
VGATLDFVSVIWKRKEGESADHLDGEESR